MKKLLFLLLLMIGTLTANAEDYSYLTFETTDGVKVSVPVASLTVTISGTTLTAGSHTFELINLSKMYFSMYDEVTGIGTPTISDADWKKVTAVYDLNGREVTKSEATKGVYIVKTKSGIHKIVVR